MKKLIITLGTAMAVAIGIQAQTAFTAGRLAVLRIGDGRPDTGGTNQASDWNFKQNPDFIDEFDPNVSSPSAPTYTMAFPTNGANSIWNNGNAGSEADSMARSADRSVLTYSAYNGNILSIPGTPSSNPYHRIISVIDAFGTNGAAFIGDNWYGIATGKTNPRGVVTDGTNNFWGSGNNGGTLFYSPNVDDGQPFSLQNFTPTRAVKIINNTVYTTITGKDSLNTYPCGIYNFVQFDGVTPNPMPMSFAGFHLVVPCTGKYTNISGFYMNDQGTIAYLADQVWGVQKYVKSGGNWNFICNYNVQGYEQNASHAGLLVTNDAAGFGGAWDVVADFSGTNPVIYATTCDYSFYSGNFNSNRVVRIVDTNSVFSAVDLTNFTVIGIAHGTNAGFRAIEFTPDLRPIISSVTSDQSVVNGTAVTNLVNAWESYTASTNSPISYQWYEIDPVSNTTNAVIDLIAGNTATNSQLVVNPALDPGYADAFGNNTNITIFCVVSNGFGAVTSSPAKLFVTATPQAPAILNGGQNLTNAVGDNVTITVNAAGTTPLNYQWYAGNPTTGGTLLTDAAEFTGTATSTLNIGNAQYGIDNGSYYCVVSNIAGSQTNLLAALTLVYTRPAFSASPSSLTVISNSSAAFTCAGFGSSLTYQWYTSNKVAIAGATTTTLAINPATTNQGYFVVCTNLGGAITSAVATLTVIIPPAHSQVNYTNSSQVYVQNFDSLPVITNATVNTGNPVTFLQTANQAGKGSVTYSVADPFDFTYPVVSSGGVGGLGLTNTMQGWYGWGQVATKLGAHQGDQSTGGIIDYGVLTNATSGENNRALGAQSTSTTGSSAFGLKLINTTTNALSYVTLKYIGELWRNQPNSNDIVFSYYIDAAGTNSVFVPTNPAATFIPSLNITFNTNAGGLLTLDGSNPANQISLAVRNLAIGTWPTNAALWLVWQQLNSAGSEQGEAIDNLSFSAASVLPATVITPLNITPGSTHLVGSGASAVAQFSFTNASGLSFSVLATNNIAAPEATWPVIGTAVESPAGSGSYQFTDPKPVTNSTRFYLLRQP